LVVKYHNIPIIRYVNNSVDFCKKRQWRTKMSVSRHFLIVGLSVLFINILSCSKRTDISGLYVHYRGILKYYTMTIEKTGGNDFKLIFEGVPLENYKSTEWSYTCSGPVTGSVIKCGDFRVDFSAGKAQAAVEYPDKAEQVFINNKQDIEEDIKIYEKDQEAKE
jgi:hypothetical protein